ncbi:hypothetical protein BDZ85DRAFT_255084 [Elsinoe ampelina]|uniref:Transcriptional regulator n=1 Tax=Elsinoe ampelina TaxID=302913 RepID=A0A6A6GQF6_9PEZI|nr:hypothetical protein BDZ85DRAFT_255084 [Elsinoe ampelina]
MICIHDTRLNASGPLRLFGRSTMPATPADEDIESALRQAVDAIVSRGEELTVNKARTEAEEELGLEAGYFKAHDHWKDRSKTIIQKAHQESESPPPKEPAKKTTNAKATAKPKAEPKPTKKRATAATDKPRKRQKKSKVESEEELSDAASPSDESEEEDSPQPVPKKKADKPVIKDRDDSSVLSDAQDPTTPSEDEQTAKPSATSGLNGAADSESELSDVIDEPAPKKKRASSAPKKDAKTKQAPKSKSGGASKAQEVSPDEAEIKRLQGWLVKCGIRKLWGKELKPFETNKAKIKHLKSMLEDAGMSGRYSNEKASSIKEARELAADLEAVQEGNKHWGQDKDGASASDSDEEDAATPPPPRRSVTSRFVDFGDEDEDDD